MTKKHFIALANLIKARKDLFTPTCVDSLADFLEDMYPKFDRQRWIDYISGKVSPSGGEVKHKKEAI